MDLYAKGQLSYLILNCLLERDFYGLDIISGIAERSNGKINLKKPSVYSNLTRMEKQGFVSAYLKSSDLGPNRKYYSITEKGRNFYKELNDYFERNNIDVFRDFADSDAQESPITPVVEIAQNSETELQQQVDDTNNGINENGIDDNLEINDVDNTENDYFDFSSIDEDANETVNENMSESEIEINNNKETLEKENIEQSNYAKLEERNENYIQEDEYNNETTTFEEQINTDDPIINEDNEENNIVENQAEEVENLDIIDKADEAEFASQEKPEDYNQRIYDISKEINKYRKKKSFAEDQISISVNSPLSESQERTNQNIQSFRNSFDDEKSKTETEKISQYDFSKQMEYRFNRTAEEDEEEKKDDAKYITERIEVTQSARKITPPRLKIVENAGQKENRLPPPKRDTSIDPSHKEILSRLYSKTKDNSSDVVRDDAIYDYADLKDYYNSQNITFTEYKKPAQKYTHNTNKLYLILSIMIFACASVISAITFIALKFTSQLNHATNFLFIVLPAILLLDVAIKAYNYKIYSSWFPKQMLAPWKIWTITIFLVGAIIGLNAIWGLGSSEFARYSTTLLLPIFLVLLIVPVRYYVKRFMLVKYWR